MCFETVISAVLGGFFGHRYPARVEVIGISCYSSKDLLHWTNEGTRTLYGVCSMSVQSMITYILASVVCNMHLSEILEGVGIFSRCTVP